ncbi:helix-turn-helix domain-containing protein [Ruminococcus albus]|uniref:Transposase n=1 Tax=Ruminococcus albus TaxID=1264 RepID=A0A1H7PTJ6_RUMAL|nr:Transposase [Ruminococcus albus]
MIANKYGINFSYFRKLVILFQDALETRKSNKKYTAETKLAAVKEYLEGKGSLIEICKKYHITYDSILIRWIKCYNSGKEFKERTRSKR